MTIQIIHLFVRSSFCCQGEVFWVFNILFFGVHIEASKLSFDSLESVELKKVIIELKQVVVRFYVDWFRSSSLVNRSRL